ncbi:MAG: cytochrome c biogenesis protein ResB [Chloroflexi bacterium]|nr:MAG: cytochrome c biogenesis protein ResB [Chloroflexota bacterium]
MLPTHLRSFWREYTRMRTAIMFLVGVVLIVLIGSFVPQRNTSAQTKVDEFLVTHQNLNGLASHVGLPLTEVFVSPLFYVLLGSLYLALGACVLRRGRSLVVRTMRRSPRTPQYWGEWGSWLFHTSFFLLLVAVVWGKATGFDGIITVTEGQRVTEARANFDTLQEGLLFDGNHSGYQVQLNSFRADYAANGEAKDYVSNVSVLDHGRLVERRDVRVNDFLGYRNVDFYQQDYGWAPRLVVRNPSGQSVFDGPVQFFGADKSVETGVLKVPDFGYTVPGAKRSLQIGARMAIFPDARTIAAVNPDGSIDPSRTEYGPGGNQARNPALQVQLFVGDLGLDRGRAQNVNELDTAAMQPYFSNAQPVPLLMGQTLRLPLPAGNGQSADFTVSFPELKQYSLFHVKKDNGVPLVYLTFALIMAGLMTKLYLRPWLQRRRKSRTRTLPAFDWAGEEASPAPDHVGAAAGME